MFKYLFLILLLIVFIGSYMLSNYYNFLYGISFYGLIMMIYFINQIICSYFNNKYYFNLSRKNWININNKRKQIINNEIVSYDAFKCVLLMVGHREREDYWEKALLSIKNLDTKNLLKVYLIIDGNEEEDKYMKKKVELIFNDDIFNIPIDCIEISKRGKRGAMFYGLELIKKDFIRKEKYIDVVVSDSDTELSKESLIYLQECLRSNLNNGCATGLLYIYNMKDGLLPKIINARYTYAFMIERSSSSFFGTMTCCSGPISIYSLDKLNDLILKKFITQKFLNKKCEPGDDRHLTNLILALGYYARQTNLAKAGTEAPETMYRFLNQQLRWSRSYYRELYWQLKGIDKQSLYLCFNTVYETLFPLFITIWIIRILYFNNKYDLIIKGLIISFSILLTRTIILICYLKNLQMIYNLFYYPLYTFLLLPTKLFAILSIVDNNWVTNPRKIKKHKNNFSFYFLFLAFWNLLLLGGIIKQFFNYFK